MILKYFVWLREEDDKAQYLLLQEPSFIFFDNSLRQLAQDRFVADREEFNIVTFEGDMRDLSVFPDEGFDLIVHSVSNCFVPDVKKVWMETYRVLRSEGELISGFINPIDYLFDEKQADEGIYQLRYKLPYSDLSCLSKEQRIQIYGESAPIEFGHSLEDQIGGTDEGRFCDHRFL